ncbi:MAG: ureidoglycolate lyase [Deltaproteobacteria bacterium]|nr:ureidoglycolate lyase [Deltaproteobacteria bacterium]
MKTVVAQPIERERYAPYGSLVAAGDEHTARSANHGTAQAWDAQAVLESRRGPAARCTASLFRCQPWNEGELVPVLRLERHPSSTQLFAPMRASRFLVVVARGGDRPDLSSLDAFVVEGPCAITYAPGVWHHPMIALDETADFVNALFSDGTDGDCHEVAIAPGLVQVQIPPR